MRTMLSFIPGQSSPEEGLAYQAYTLRLAKRFGVPEEAVCEALPPGSQEWRYSEVEDPEWWGKQGFFHTEEDVMRLAEALGKGSAASGSK